MHSNKLNLKFKKCKQSFTEVEVTFLCRLQKYITNHPPPPHMFNKLRVESKNSIAGRFPVSYIPNGLLLVIEFPSPGIIERCFSVKKFAQLPLFRALSLKSGMHKLRAMFAFPRRLKWLKFSKPFRSSYA